MSSNAIANAHVCTFAKDSSKKKRGSKLGKLKQNKLDVRRGKWLSQVNNNAEEKATGRALPPSMPKHIQEPKTQGNLPTRARREEHQVLTTYDNEPVCWTNNSVVSKSGRNSLSKDFYRSRNIPNGSCSSCCSEEEKERDDGSLHDWEAVADALATDDNSHSLDSEPEPLIDNGGSKSVDKMKHRCQRSSRAWSPDDVFRPRSLPSVPKQQHSLTMQNSEHGLSQGPAMLSRQSVVSQQQSSACPICCEDFDVTDSSFLPCPCGFRLCLFCHRRILEVDGRCPGCRKQYDSVDAGAGLPGVPFAFPTTDFCIKNTRF